MEQNKDRIVKLIYRRLKGLPLTVQENQEVEAWLSRSESNRRIFENLSDEEWVKEAKKIYYAPGKKAGLAQLREQIMAETPMIRPFRWARVAVAASVLFILAAAIYLMVPTKQGLPVALTELKNQLEILPGGEAIITLSNGSKIPLREQANGLLAQLGNGKHLIKQDGKLVYQSAAAQSTAGGVDTTIDPRSDQYSVVLPDGSRVWLNRGSTLNYPENFVNNTRIVELSGEAYFEIAQLADANGQGKMPFVVRMQPDGNNSPPAEVEVLGTHFNIYAHKGEPIKTTLAEGKVKMSTGNISQVLEPGQQAVLDNPDAAHIQLRDNISVENVLAWRKNKFHFKDEPIGNIIAELSRWYDNPFAIEGKIDTPFTLIYDRNKPLSEVLTKLNESGKAHIKMDGDIIVVTP